MPDERMLMAQTENLALEIKRRIDAPRERVFDAFTVPEQIVKWIGPAERDALSADVDLRVGGEYRFRFNTDTHGELEFFFEWFPATYHEPYFKGYIEDDLRGVLEETGFEVERNEPNAMSKVIVGRKPAN